MPSDFYVETLIGSLTIGVGLVLGALVASVQKRG